MPPRAPPTTAVLCFSLLQTFSLDVRVASRSDGEAEVALVEAVAAEDEDMAAAV